MNHILEALIRRAVAREVNPAEAMQAAWDSGIQEGIARQRLGHILHNSADDLLYDIRMRLRGSHPDIASDIAEYFRGKGVDIETLQRPEPDAP